ncbi:MAG: DnaB-like helicase C-terminal domain-containing protein [Bacillota bacterium]
MKKYGYGGQEEALYLQAYNFAKEGNPTLLFSFESATIKLNTILMSHLLKIEMDKLRDPSEEVLNQINEAKDLFNVPLSYVDETSLTLEEIERFIQKNKKEKHVTHVVLDRVNDTKQINQLALKLGVKVYY